MCVCVYPSRGVVLKQKVGMNQITFKEGSFLLILYSQGFYKRELALHTWEPWTTSCKPLFEVKNFTHTQSLDTPTVELRKPQDPEES